MRPLYKYDTVPGFMIRNDLQKIGLTGAKLEAAEAVLSKYTFMRFKKPEKTSLGWRLTSPLFGLTFIFCALIYCPIRWFATGNYYLNDKTGMGKFLYNWVSRLGYK